MLKNRPYRGKAGDYAAHRPAYANQAIDDLVTWSGLQADWVVADIGSGTGNLGRELLERAHLVYAVEPDQAMRREAVQLLGWHPGFLSLAGSAENTGLADGSVDLITAGQAVHWFEAAAALAEFRRILKPPGRLALVWNDFRGGAGPDLAQWFQPGSLKRGSYPVTLHETWDQYLGGQRSAASSPNPGEAGYAEFERRQREVFDSQAQAGLVTVQYTTELAVGWLKNT